MTLGILTSACQWMPVVILGRLTYCAYLIHVFVLRFRAANGHEKVYMQPYIMVILCLFKYLRKFAICRTILKSTILKLVDL